MSSNVIKIGRQIKNETLIDTNTIKLSNLPYNDVPSDYMREKEIDESYRKTLQELVENQSKKTNLENKNTNLPDFSYHSVSQNHVEERDVENNDNYIDILNHMEYGNIPEDFLINHRIQDVQYEIKSEEDNKKKFVNENKKQKSCNIDYEVYKQLLERYIFKCHEGMMYLYDEENGCFRELSDNKLRVIIRSKWPAGIEQLLNKRKVEDIIDRLKSNEEIQMNEDQFDKYTHLINFKNCVVDVLSGKILPHSPKYCFKSFINAQYDLNTSKGETFIKFIRQCTENNKHKMKLIQEILGYVISNYTTAKKFFVFIGQPHSGKSTLLDVLKEIVGKEYTTAIPIHQLGERFMKAKLFQAKLNISGEMTDGELKNLDTLKAITGNDDIIAENKGKDPFTFKCKAKLIFAGNHMPRLYKLDSTSAFFDRIIFVLFNNSVPEHERDYRLKEKLLAERDYIVVWAVQGLKRLIKNNFVFTECEESRRFKNQYIKEVNTVLDFIETRCILDVHDSKIRIHKRDLYEAYINYCKDNCVKALDKYEFFTEIKKFPVEARKFRYNGSTPLEGFIGISLKERFGKKEMSY
ncbi:DNA primase family protein [Anoxybacillus gonensis]|uniref:Phage/plasmid primase, P4 family n=1 Tax=Anoxybacillus gonensis TaxID=198467 RepID=A0AAW7TMW7_9BACL|nr:phage/plasmid primase, P4 family [Anoxybacillus gonensis]MDO0878150.1 phage/plasmid primase, P4 family [Anoxybacillus gonensis]